MQKRTIGTYDGVMIKDGLVFDSDSANVVTFVSGGTVYDLSTQRMTGTTVNGATFTGGTWNFDGVNDYVELNSNSYGGTGGTISGWFKIDDGTRATTLDTLIGIANTDYSTEFTYISLGGNASGADRGILYVKRTFDTDFRHGSSAFEGEKWKDGVWHNLTVVIDGVENSFYVDGNKQTIDYFGGVGGLQGKEFLNPYQSRNLTTIVIGARRTSVGVANHFKGNISNVLIYNRGLSQAEVRQNYEALKYRYE